MKDMYGCIRKTVITEKSNIQKEVSNKVTFEVDRRANKIEIKNAVQKLFNVKVVHVNIMNFEGKSKRVGRIIGKKSDWKKAVVTLNQGEKIEFFEGV
ncbi:MAG: 50S ribosomal protein L23 [Pseudomonadota bacterium]